MSGNSQNGVKRCHRIKTAIEPEHILIEVGLQVLWLNTTMMRPSDPSFQIAENEMDHGQVRLRFVRVAAKRQRFMAISHLWKAGVASPAVGAQRGTKRNIVFDKAGKCIGAPVGHTAKPQPPRIDAARVLLAVVRSRPNLNGADHNRLVVSAATFAACLAADEAFVNLDRMLAADGVALGANHTSAELVEYLEGCLITRERKLTLELNSGLSWDLRGHQVCAPKPRRERRVARLHDGSGSQRRIGLTTTTAQHYRRPSCETVWLSNKPTFWTRKPARPTNGFKVAGASRIIGKDPLKLRKRSWEAANVHARDIATLSHLCQETG